MSASFGCIIFFMGVLQAVNIRYLYEVGGDKEVRRQFLSDLLQVFFCKLVVCLEQLFMFICPRCNVSELLICVELHQWLEPL
jgi:hypothetical protein